MKTNFLSIIVISAMIMMTSCQKEIPALTNSNKTAASNSNLTGRNGAVLLKEGVPYLNTSSTNTSIGWFLDVGLLQENINSTKAMVVSNLGDASMYCGGITSIDLLAGQNILMGTLTYANDATNLYVTYTTNSDWYMSEVHLYVGLLSGVPKSGGGTPSPGRFPMKQTFASSNLSQEVTWTIPISSIPTGSNFAIAAHTSVLRVDIDGDVVAKETAWAAGTRFTSNKNWATYITASLRGCETMPEGDLKNINTNNQ